MQELRVFSFFVGVAIHSLHHRSARRGERQLGTWCFPDASMAAILHLLEMLYIVLVQVCMK